MSSDGHFATGTGGLTNARTRIVGSRTGVLADLVVGVVRLLRSLRRGIRRLGRRAADVVTPLGWTMVALVPLGFVFGYGLGWLELVVAAWAGLVLLVVAAIYLIGRTRLTVSLSLPQRRTVVGEAVVGELVVANPGRLRTLGTTLEVPVGRGLAEIAVSTIAARAERRQEFTVPALRRGVVSVGPAATTRPP